MDGWMDAKDNKVQSGKWMPPSRLRVQWRVSADLNRLCPLWKNCSPFNKPFSLYRD